MNNKGSKKLIYIILTIFAIFFGCGLMYAIVYFFPSAVISTVTQEQKIVNVVDDGIAEGINNVYNSVVVVESYKNNLLLSIGSGFAFKSEDDDTYILTNHHVIDGASQIIITLEDTTEIIATLVGSDVYSDIAVLKVENSENLKVATIGSTEDMKIGDTVFAVGSPMGKKFANTVTRGILSGKNRLLETTISSTNEEWLMNVIQTDAAINPGNSGGPLCNASGSVIGVNSLKIVESSVEGLGFAITIEDALNYAQSIIENGKITRGYVGIKMLNASQTFQLLRNNIKIDSDIENGIVVVEVIKDSPAEDAKLQKQDVIVKINEKDVENISEFRYYLYQIPIGNKAKLTIIRDNNPIEIVVEIKEAN